MTNSTRCAACKYLRRRCHSDCIFAPYFPSNNPQRFASVHRIYGASNVGKMLQQLQENVRAKAVDSLYYEAQCRIQDPVYGCVGQISRLHQQINDIRSELAKTRAEVSVISYIQAKEGAQLLEGETQDHQVTVSNPAPPNSVSCQWQNDSFGLPDVEDFASWST